MSLLSFTYTLEVLNEHLEYVVTKSFLSPLVDKSIWHLFN